VDYFAKGTVKMGNMLTPDFCVGALNTLIQNVREMVKAWSNRKDTEREQHWDVLMAAVTTLEKLVREHLEAIKLTTAPVLERNDLVGTYKNFETLVNNDDLPMGYSKLRGEIRRCSQTRAFSEAARSSMVDLLERLRDFQVAAFTLDLYTPDPDESKGHLPSIIMLHVFETCTKQLLPILEKPVKSPDDIKTINGLGSWVRSQFGETAGVYQEPRAGPAFESSQQLIDLAKTWCSSWLERVRAPLILGNGVTSKIGALEAQRPAG
jgi:hypothetical protein